MSIFSKKDKKYFGIIIVTHRITTIKNVDKIYFLGANKVIGSGNYDSLQKTVLEFADWVHLLDSQKRFL